MKNNDSNNIKINRGFVLLIIVLIISLIGAGIYIAYDARLFSKDSNTIVTNTYNNNTNNTVEDIIDDTPIIADEILLNDSRFYSIYEKLKPYTYNKNRSDGYNSFTDQELFEIISMDLIDNDFVQTNETYDNGYYYTLDNSIVINYLKKYFGNDVKINGSNIVNPGVVYTTKVNYNGSGLSIVSYENNTYKVKFSGIGTNIESKTSIIERKIDFASLRTDNILIKEKAIYYDYEGNMYNIYSDVNKTNRIDTKEYSYTVVSDNFINVDNYDKTSNIMTMFAYDKETDKYYFQSSVIE